MRPEEYGLVILGSGAGSKFAAWTFAGQRQRRRYRAQIYRRLVPEHCLSAEQKYHSQREDCSVLSQE